MIDLEGDYKTYVDITDAQKLIFERIEARLLVNNSGVICKIAHVELWKLNKKM